MKAPLGISMMILMLAGIAGCHDTILTKRINITDEVSVLMPEKTEKTELNDGTIVYQSKADSADLLVLISKIKSADTIGMEKRKDFIGVNMDRFLEARSGKLIHRKDAITGEVVSSDFEYEIGNPESSKYGTGRMVVQGPNFIIFLCEMLKPEPKSASVIRSAFFRSIKIEHTVPPSGKDYAESESTRTGDREVQPKPFVLGVIEELRSEILNEPRILNIYLPEGYEGHRTTRYPVIYLLDGSADEDFIHVAGLVQFYSFPWIRRLPGSILVGIATVNRMRDYTLPSGVAAEQERFPAAGGSQRFISFIEKELQPFIEKKYRTLPEKTLIGQSLGGLLATEILVEKPALFNRYIVISPSLWWDNGSMLDQASELSDTHFAQPAAIYIGVGKEGPTPTTPPRIMEEDAKTLADQLSSLKNGNVKVFFDYLPEENHATISYQALFNAIRLLHPLESDGH